MAEARLQKLQPPKRSIVGKNDITFGIDAGSKNIQTHFKEFPFLGIWTTDDDAPFLCLEPWAGHADYEGFQGDYLEKEDNVLLHQNESRTFSYTIEIR